MDFSLSEEAQMVVDMAGQFADRHLAPSMRVHEKEQCCPSGVVEAFEASGLAMLGALEEDPDMPMPWPARCQAIQRLAMADGATTLVLWTQAWLPHVAQRLGVSEAGAGVAGYLHLVQDIEAVSWPIVGIPIGGRDHVLVLDRNGAWGLARVDTAAIRTLGLAAASPAQCTLDEWIERGETNAEESDHAWAIARLWGAAILAGISRAALDYTCTYVQERVAFGRPLSNHQGVAFIVADMAMRVEGVDLLTSRAAWSVEGGVLSAATDAWLEASEAALWVTDSAVQMLGGHGYTQDHPVEKWMRDARSLTLLWGGPDAGLADASESLEEA